MMQVGAGQLTLQYKTPRDAQKLVLGMLPGLLRRPILLS
jgi:hypothetical protein